MLRSLSLLVLLLVPMLFAAEKGKAPRPSLVVTAPVTKGVVKLLQSYVGTLYYDRQSQIASEFEGVVSTLRFQEGQHVKKGDVLVRLDTKVLEANIDAKESGLKALEADLTRQERELDRSKALLKRNSISQSSYDLVFYGTEQLRAQVAALRSELKAKQIELKKNAITAPYDAIVTTRDVDIGEWVGKGATVATLVDPQSIEARLNVPAALITVLRKDEKQYAAVIDGRDVDVTLERIIPQADTVSRTFPIELSVPKTMGLIEGMRIDVQIPTLKEQESLQVPRDAVIKRFGQTIVFTVVNGKAMMLPVQVIGYKKEMVAIMGKGLTEKMRVVTKGNERIFPNMPLVEKRGK